MSRRIQSERMTSTVEARIPKSYPRKSENEIAFKEQEWSGRKDLSVGRLQMGRHRLKEVEDHRGSLVSAREFFPS